MKYYFVTYFKNKLLIKCHFYIYILLYSLIDLSTLAFFPRTTLYNKQQPVIYSNKHVHDFGCPKQQSTALRINYSN